MHKNTTLTILLNTMLLSGLHFFLACLYHYTTRVSLFSGMFDVSMWSDPYRQTVLGLTLFIVFFGFIALIVDSVVLMQTKTNKTLKQESPLC
jgi:phosphate starvation-inducible membrane PsiE